MADIQNERELLESVFRSKHDLPSLEAYAAALEQGGEQRRANILQLILEAIKLGGKAKDLDNRLRVASDALSASEIGWSSLMGLEVARTAAQNGTLDRIAGWLSLALPALDVKWRLASAPDEVGTSRFYGDPDLPPDFPWPTLGECSSYFELKPSDIDPTSRCRFVAQINCDDLAVLPGVEHLRGLGLLSVFAFSEYDKFGISEVCALHFPSDTRLVRRPHLDLDEANERMPDRSVEFTPTLSLPEHYDSPWADDVAKIGRLNPDELGGRDTPAERFGLLGHTHATTGADPSLGKKWQRLFCFPADDYQAIWHHVIIKNDDLARGELEHCQGTWVDMDG